MKRRVLVGKRILKLLNDELTKKSHQISFLKSLSTSRRVLISDIFLLRNVIVGLAAQKRTTMMMMMKKHKKANAEKKEWNFLKWHLMRKGLKWKKKKKKKWKFSNVSKQSGFKMHNIYWIGRGMFISRKN